MSAVLMVPMYVEILRADDAAGGLTVYRETMPWEPMPWHAQRADLIAATLLGVLACAVGTAVGLASADVRAKNGPQSGPLRMILPAGNEAPSIQRDRVRLQRSR
jgi:hypothetical protein